MKKLLIISIILLIGLTNVAAPPEPPHRVYGEITDTVASEDNLRVEFTHSGSAAVETSTDQNGLYDVKIPYDSSYNGNQLSLRIEGADSGKTVTFESGGSTELNYEGSNLRTDDFQVTGTITLPDNGEDNVGISFYYDGSEIAGSSTDGSGDYSLTVPFDENYNTKDIELYVDGDSTGNTTTFESGGSAELNYEEQAEETTEETEEEENNDEDSGSSGGSTDTSTEDEDETNDSNDDDSDSDNNDQSSENEDPEESVQITDISVVPEDPGIGDSVEIFVTVTNTGSQTVDYMLSVSAGSEQLQTQVEGLEAGETRAVTFEREFESAEQISISAGDESHSFSVSESASQEESGGIGFIQIMGIVGGLLMVIVIVYLFLDSRKKTDMDEEQKGALDAFKEKKAKEKGDSDGFGWKYANDDD